jgi:hypothetical protein
MDAKNGHHAGSVSRTPTDALTGKPGNLLRPSSATGVGGGDHPQDWKDSHVGTESAAAPSAPRYGDMQGVGRREMCERD